MRWIRGLLKGFTYRVFDGEGSYLIPLLFINFIGTFGLSIVLPFLVFLVTDFGGNAFIYGVVAATYPVFQLIGGPVLGRWSDLYGRKRILLLSHTGTFLSWIVFLAALLLPEIEIFSISSRILGAFVITIPLLVIFIARGLDGLTGGNVSVANAYIADVTDDDNRSKNYGKMSISTNLGFIAGPLFAGILAGTRYGYSLPVIGAIFITFMGIIVIVFMLPEPLSCSNEFEKKPEIRENDNHKKTEKNKRKLNISELKKLLGLEFRECIKAIDPLKPIKDNGKYGEDKKNNGKKRTRKMGIRDVLSMPYIFLIMVMYFLMFIGFNLFYTAFPVHAIENLGWNVQKMGLYFSYLSLMLVIVQGPVLTRVSKKYSDSILVFAGCFLLGTNFILLESGDQFLTYLAAVFFALGNGVMWPSINSILSKVAGKVHQGAVQGVASAVTSLSSIFGLLAGGYLYGKIGSSVFLIAAFTIYISTILSVRFISVKEWKSEK